MKKMLSIQTKTIRELIALINEANIQKEDIVSILDKNDIYVLLYYSE